MILVACEVKLESGLADSLYLAGLACIAEDYFYSLVKAIGVPGAFKPIPLPNLKGTVVTSQGLIGTESRSLLLI